MIKPNKIPFDVNVENEHSSAVDMLERIHADYSSSATDIAVSDTVNPSTSEFDNLHARYASRWNKLISQTNWEKGKIISQWRMDLIDNQVAVSEYSDESWARQVEGVSAQHVGRLRRVHDRFGKTYSSYEGLYWTHFLAAMDWDDAELWLEGAKQSKWSISQMRRKRWEVTGADEADEPVASDMVTSEIDEEVAQQNAAAVDRESDDRIGSTGPLREGPDFGDEDGERASSDNDEEAVVTYEDDDTWDPSASNEDDSISPFASLPQLPVDVADAMEQFKLAIVRHRSTDWQDCTLTDVLKVIEALRSFALRDN